MKRHNIRCEDVRINLDECFGQEALPPELEAHVSHCDECREYWNEVENIKTRLRTDESFFLDAAEVDVLTAGVMKRIDAKRPAQKTDLYRLAQIALPVAASLLVLLGIANLSQRLFTDDQPHETVTEILNDNNLLASTDGEELEMDAATFDLLVGDFAFGENPAPGEELLNDLTNDELEYLIENLDIGELL